MKIPLSDRAKDGLQRLWRNLANMEYNMPCTDAGPKGLYPNLEWEVVKKATKYHPEMVVAAFMSEEDADLAIDNIFSDEEGEFEVRHCPC